MLTQTYSSPARAWPALGIAPGQVLRAFGMRRSGNHAIISWLQRNAPEGRSVFFNNCKPGQHPLQSFRGMEVNGAHAPQNKARRDMASVTGAAGDGALVLISYEDTSPAEFGADRQVSGTFDETRLSSNVLIYRSFLNWSASLLKKLQANEGYSLVRRNAILLRAMDTYTRLLGLVRQAKESALVAICYDSWVAKDSYRTAVLTQLGLAEPGQAPRDNSLGEVQPYGGGSSFQKQAKTAAELQVDRRWQQMRGDAEFQALLHLAARDTALIDELTVLFPQDAEFLATVAQQPPLPQAVRA